jgi:hypothetical protein
VEQRANAFAAEFLAPQDEVVALWRRGGVDPVGEVMDVFGISFTVARYQIWNGLDRSVPMESLVTSRRVPGVDWEGREAFAIDCHPLHHVRPSRAGRFGAVALRAAEEGLISHDTVATWLEESVNDVRDAALEIRGLFPTVWPPRG